MKGMCLRTMRRWSKERKEKEASQSLKPCRLSLLSVPTSQQRTISTRVKTAWTFLLTPRQWGSEPKHRKYLRGGGPLWGPREMKVLSLDHLRGLEDQLPTNSAKLAAAKERKMLCRDLFKLCRNLSNWSHPKNTRASTLSLRRLPSSRLLRST